MKSLTYRQASACENATTRRCRCRCAGRYHGAGRGEVVALGAGDPHAVDRIPYEIADSGVQLSLFADVGPLERIEEIRSRLLGSMPPDRGRPTMSTHNRGSRPSHRPTGPTAA